MINHLLRGKSTIILIPSRQYLLDNSSFLDRTINNPRKFGLSEFQSSHSIQNSTITYSIPKQERFKNLSKGWNDNFYIQSQVSSKRSTTLGKGNKLDMSKLVSRNSPSPDTYNLNSTLKKNYVTIKSKFQDSSLNCKLKIPGPADYNLGIKNSTLPTTLKFRHGFFYEDEFKSKKYQISPQAYTPHDKFVLPSRYDKLKFGTESRGSINQTKSNYPGPGYYNLPSVFDKSRKYKLAIN